MARTIKQVQQPIELVMQPPVTILPQRRKPKPQPTDGPKSVVIPKKTPGKPFVDIDLEHTLQWIAWVDSPEKCYSFDMHWEAVNARIATLGFKPDKTALRELPKVVGSPSFNGGGLLGWISLAEADQIDSLQKVYAAMRLRYRHANWLRRKKG